MAFTGSIVYVNGAIAPESYGFVVDDVTPNHGSYYTQLSVPPSPTVPSARTIQIHVYRDGLLIHVMKPRSEWGEETHGYASSSSTKYRRLILMFED